MKSNRRSKRRGEYHREMVLVLFILLVVILLDWEFRMRRIPDPKASPYFTLAAGAVRPSMYAGYLIYPAPTGYNGYSIYPMPYIWL